MRLWWVSISLFIELEGEQGVVIFSCCSCNWIPHWLMRLERSEELVLSPPPSPPPPPLTLGRETWWTRWSSPSPPPSSCCRWRQCSQCQSGLRRRSQGDPPVPGIANPWLVVLLLLLLFICSLAKAVSDVNDAMML